MKKFPFLLPNVNEDSIIEILRTQLTNNYNIDSFRALSNFIIDTLSSVGSLVIIEDKDPLLGIYLNSFPHPTFYDYINYDWKYDGTPYDIRYLLNEGIELKYTENSNYNNIINNTNPNYNALKVQNNNIYISSLSAIVNSVVQPIPLLNLSIFEEIIITFMKPEDIPNSLARKWALILALYNNPYPLLFNFWTPCTYTIDDKKNVKITKMSPQVLFFPPLSCLFVINSILPVGCWSGIRQYTLFEDIENLASAIEPDSCFFLPGQEFYPLYSKTANEHQKSITYNSEQTFVKEIHEKGGQTLIPAENIVIHENDIYFKIYPIKFEKRNNTTQIKIDIHNPEYITYKYFVEQITKMYGKKAGSFIKSFIEIIASWKYEHFWLPYTPLIFLEDIETNYYKKLEINQYMTNFINNFYFVGFPNILITLNDFHHYKYYIKNQTFITVGKYYNGNKTYYGDATYKNILFLFGNLFNLLRYMIEKNSSINLKTNDTVFFDPRTESVNSSHPFLPVI